MSEETGTATAAQRFGVVMSWIPAIAIVVRLSVFLLLIVIAGYEGWESDLLLVATIWGLGDCLLGLFLVAFMQTGSELTRRSCTPPSWI